MRTTNTMGQNVLIMIMEIATTSPNMYPQNEHVLGADTSGKKPPHLPL